MSQNHELSLTEAYQDIDKGIQLLLTYTATLPEYITLLKDKLSELEKIYPRPSQPQQEDLPLKHTPKEDQVPKETIQLRRLEKHCIKKKKEAPAIFTPEFKSTLQRILEEHKQREEEKEYEEMKKSFQQREQFWKRVEEDTASAKRDVA
ncbi:hypothetical protein RSAG8_11438, partial [Rhizoctonia solani AG-8 WAC10335]